LPCIANDLVDWKYPANAEKSRDLRYLKKILTDVEIEIVQKTGNQDAALWSLWACKETAYKALKKLSPDTLFQPRYWSVELDRPGSEYGSGKVVVPGKKPIFVRIYLSDAYVHCIGTDELSNLDKIVWGVDPLPPASDGIDIDPSVFVRKCLLRRLANSYSLNIRNMEIRRAKQSRELLPPCLYLDDKKAPFDISLSHDGKFVAYALVKLLDQNQ
jgi:phosphopantetheinyl transferase (holo-ACP synthase)